MNITKREEGGGSAAPESAADKLRKLLEKVWGKPTKKALKRAETDRHAEYLVCPVCRQIMSHRANKLVVIGKDMLRRPIYSHRICAEIFKRKQAEKAKMTIAQKVVAAISKGV